MDRDYLKLLPTLATSASASRSPLPKADLEVPVLKAKMAPNQIIEALVIRAEPRVDVSGSKTSYPFLLELQTPLGVTRFLSQTTFDAGSVLLLKFDLQGKPEIVTPDTPELRLQQLKAAINQALSQSLPKSDFSGNWIINIARLLPQIPQNLISDQSRALLQQVLTLLNSSPEGLKLLSIKDSQYFRQIAASPEFLRQVTQQLNQVGRSPLPSGTEQKSVPAASDSNYTNRTESSTQNPKLISEAASKILAGIDALVARQPTDAKQALQQLITGNLSQNSQTNPATSAKDLSVIKATSSPSINNDASRPLTDTTQNRQFVNIDTKTATTYSLQSGPSAGQPLPSKTKSGAGADLGAIIGRLTDRYPDLLTRLQNYAGSTPITQEIKNSNFSGIDLVNRLSSLPGMQQALILVAASRSATHETAASLSSDVSKNITNHIRQLLIGTSDTQQRTETSERKPQSVTELPSRLPLALMLSVLNSELSQTLASRPDSVAHQLQSKAVRILAEQATYGPNIKKPGIPLGPKLSTETRLLDALRTEIRAGIARGHSQALTLLAHQIAPDADKQLNSFEIPLILPGLTDKAVIETGQWEGQTSDRPDNNERSRLFRIHFELKPMPACCFEIRLSGNATQIDICFWSQDTHNLMLFNQYADILESSIRQSGFDVTSCISKRGLPEKKATIEPANKNLVDIRT